MNEDQQVAILNQAFVRVYRSFSVYAKDSSIVSDVGTEEDLQSIFDACDQGIERLGLEIVERQGGVFTGHPRMELGGVHFANLSTVLPEWIADQKDVIVGLEKDRSALASAKDEIGVQLLDGVLDQARQIAARLEKLAKSPAKHAVPA